MQADPTVVPDASTASSVVLDPVSGVALPIRAGQRVRVSQLGDGQCVDVNAYALDDANEQMSAGHARRQGFHLDVGATLMSKPPYFRPMLNLVGKSDGADVDTLAARCHRVLFGHRLGQWDHPNCQDTLAEAVREYGIAPDKTHDTLNLFLSTRWDDSGQWWIEWNRAMPGDYVDFVACMDLLCVFVTCGAGDIGGAANCSFNPVSIDVYDATEASQAVASEITERLRPPADQASVDIARRPIRRDSTYRAAYPASPISSSSVDIIVSEDLLGQLIERSRRRGCVDLEDEICRTFVVWYLKHFEHRAVRGAGTEAQAVHRLDLTP